VSTTHTVAGGIAGVGSENRASSVNWSVFGRVAIDWLIAALIATRAYWGATLPSEPCNNVLMSLSRRLRCARARAL
jgi:PiT family inorganic phosphate transporter